MRWIGSPDVVLAGKARGLEDWGNVEPSDLLVYPQD
jgi:hypothetical protein